MNLQIEKTKSRVQELVESTLQISNINLVTAYVFKGENSALTPAAIRVENDIIGPAVVDAKVS